MSVSFVSGRGWIKDNRPVPTGDLNGDKTRLVRLLRGLADPIAQSLVDGLVYADRPMTRAEMRRGLHGSPDITQHLRVLEDLGLVKNIPARGPGDSPRWQASPRPIDLTGHDQDPDVVDLVEQLASARLRRRHGQQVAWERRAPSFGEVWTQAATFGDWTDHWTPEELELVEQALMNAIAEVRAHAADRRQRGERPPDEQAVTIHVAGFPVEYGD